MVRLSGSAIIWPLLMLSASYVQAGDVLKNDGFKTCMDNSDIQVKRLNMEFDRSSKTITFDVAGSSSKKQNITAALVIEAYGQEFKKDFDPCDEETKLDELCPAPSGDFAAKGTQKVPAEFIDKVPSIVFSIPDIEAIATLKLKTEDDEDLACIQSNVGNGVTLQVPAVTYAAAGIAGAALLMSGVAAVAAGGSPGAATSSPSFGEVLGWFQSMSMSGMLSVDYPPVYRSFTKNFGFSTGLIPWDDMQTSIDNFRASTGGNLTENSLKFLRNATLVFSDEENNNKSAKRSFVSLLRRMVFVTREIETSVNETPSGGDSSESEDGVNHLVSGFQGYVEQYTIPEANAFMTVLLVLAIVIAAIAVGILLVKVVLEIWAMFSSFPTKLTDFRKHYWGLMARTITTLILILYGIWTLYCIYQFRHGDSWAAILLAAITLAIFTGILAYFTFRIWRLARRFEKTDGDTSALYEDKETWRKYSLFYNNYKKGYWWIFIPMIVYLFVRGCIIAGADGNGMVQTAGQLIVEAIMLGLLIWARPYETKSGQWINMSIQVVRVLSVACILVFVHELGVSQTTKTVTGIVLVAVQSTLTGILAILIAVNAIIVCFKKNPHEKRLAEHEKAGRDLDTLTPLDARNSLTMKPSPYTPYRDEPDEEVGKLNFLNRYESFRGLTPMKPKHDRSDSTDRLVISGGPSHMRSATNGSAGGSSSVYSDFDTRNPRF